MHLRVFVRAAAVLCLASFAAVSSAATITPGNLVIYRVGTGSAALATSSTAVFLDEYTTAGTLVQSITVPSTGTSAMTAVGNASTEGIISPSQDGSSLVFTGYRKDAGGTSPASDAYTTTARVIGTVTLAGTPDTTTTLTADGGATTANTIRSATAVTGTPGSPVWTSTSTRIGYDATGLGGAGTTAQIDARNSRQVNLADSTLYASNGSTSITAKVQSYGTLPTGATTPTTVVNLATADAVNGFVLADLDGTAGADTVYALSTVENLLRKYSLVSGTWTANGSIGAGGASNLTAQVSGSTVNLYLTSGTTLSGLSDGSGFNSNITGTLVTLATAGTNTAFRGIGTFNAVPEPGTFVLLALGCCALSGGRRRSA